MNENYDIPSKEEAVEYNRNIQQQAFQQPPLVSQQPAPAPAPVEGFTTDCTPSESFAPAVDNETLASRMVDAMANDPYGAPENTNSTSMVH